MHFIHIAMKHKVPFNIVPSPELIEEIVRSQLLVAKAINKYPNCPIVLEGLYDNRTKANLNLSLASVIKSIFPKGLPQEFSQLSKLQVEFLYKNGAVYTLFHLGIIPSIYKAIPNKETSDDIDRQQSPAVRYKRRELMLMACVREAAIENFERNDNVTLLVVYGGAHNFKPYCEKERFTYEQIVTYAPPKDIFRHAPLEKITLDEQLSPAAPRLIVFDGYSRPPHGHDRGIDKKSSVSNTTTRVKLLSDAPDTLNTRRITDHPKMGYSSSEIATETKGSRRGGMRLYGYNPNTNTKVQLQFAQPQLHLEPRPDQFKKEHNSREGVAELKLPRRRTHFSAFKNFLFFEIPKKNIAYVKDLRMKVGPRNIHLSETKSRTTAYFSSLWIKQLPANAQLSIGQGCGLPKGSLNRPKK